MPGKTRMWAKASTRLRNAPAERGPPAGTCFRIFVSIAFPPLVYDTKQEQLYPWLSLLAQGESSAARIRMHSSSPNIGCADPKSNLMTFLVLGTLSGPADLDQL